MEMKLPKTIMLPYLQCEYVGHYYDQAKDKWVVEYRLESDVCSPALKDTGVPLPTDDQSKIVYERVNKPTTPGIKIVDVLKFTRGKNKEKLDELVKKLLGHLPFDEKKQGDE